MYIFIIIISSYYDNHWKGNVCNNNYVNNQEYDCINHDQKEENEESDRNNSKNTN